MCRPKEDDSHASCVSTPKSSPNHHSKPSRRVTFGPVEVLVKLNPRTCMTREERHALWYHRSDYEAFKESINDICCQVSQESDLDDEEEVCTRGLERRMSTERQLLKTKAINDILRASDEGHSTQHVADVARQSSMWASELAHKMGLHDYYVVYDPLRVSHKDYVKPCLSIDVPSLASDDDDELPSRKRCADELLHPPTRRVRMRMMAPTTSEARTSGWRRPRVAMWKPESWVEAR